MPSRDAAAGQVSGSAAEIYQDFFVPALFGEWGPRLVEAAGVVPGGSVLDVACGTGAAIEAAAAEAGPGSWLVGLDRNPGMLAVARARLPQVDWVEGRAEDLPFADAAFKAVMCQFGLMFFDDRAAALAEMYRVTRPGGRMAVAVWGPAEASPGYAAMIDLIERVVGPEAADALRAPFVLGAEAALAAEFDAADLPRPEIGTREGTARFPSVEDWVRTDVKGWTLADMIDDAQYEALCAAAPEALAEFVDADGRVRFAAPAHVAVVERA